MKPLTQIHLFGSLGKSLVDISPHLDLEAPTPLPEILESLNIPEENVQMAMVNFKAVPKDSVIHPGDRLSLFPREYPLFLDWKDLRF